MKLLGNYIGSRLTAAVGSRERVMTFRLLVADDNAGLHKMVQLAFSEDNVEIEAVTSGDDALEILNVFTPDVILADVSMPGYNGYEVCEIIRYDARFADTPVILMSGAMEDFDEEEAERVRANGHLAKPFDPSEMITLVKILLEERTQDSSYDSRDDKGSDKNAGESSAENGNKIEVPTQPEYSVTPGAVASVDFPEAALQESASIDLPEEPVSINLPEEPVSIALPEEPVSIDLPEEPVSIDLPEEPVSIALSEEPVSIALSEEPVSIDLPEEPMSIDLPEEPVSIDLPEEPVSIALPEEPVSIALPEELASFEPPEADLPENAYAKSSGLYEESDIPERDAPRIVLSSGLREESDARRRSSDVTSRAWKSYLGKDRILEIFDDKALEVKTGKDWRIPEEVIDRVAERVMEKISRNAPENSPIRYSRNGSSADAGGEAQDPASSNRRDKSVVLSVMRCRRQQRPYRGNS